jgi:3-phenylpropionate/trans-cinnamate dioxygenase ferredoxin component
MPEFVKVAKTGDIAPGEGKGVDVGERRIALFNVDGTFYAIDDTCTHRGGPLSDGMVLGNEVTCPWHGAVFDVRTGSVRGLPAPRGFTHYAVYESKARTSKSNSKSVTPKQPKSQSLHQNHQHNVEKETGDDGL